MADGPAAPSVSVVMPVYNCERYVEEAVRSVLTQTHADLELVVVDDGSSDGTPAILARLAAGDRRLRLHSQANSGRPSIARNAALARARGACIAFIDGDDVFHPRRLERGLQALARFPEVGLVFSDLAIFSSDAERAGPGHLARSRFVERAGEHLRAAGDGVFVCAPGFYRSLSTWALGLVTPQTVLVRRAVLEREPVWFPEEMTTYEDIDLWLRLALRTTFAYVDEVLAYYRRHAGNISGNLRAVAEGAVMARARNLERGRGRLAAEDVDRVTAALARNYFELGFALFRGGQVQEARSAYVRSWRLAPRGRVALALGKTFVPAPLVRCLRRLGIRR
jgi:glycosyltransferase involved in cell wall biosynthesis